MSAPVVVLPRTVTIGSLCSGVGGLDAGLEFALAGQGVDARVVWQVEHSEFCNAILAKHWPHAARSVRDVCAAGAHNLAPVDVLCAGFPCQPVSLAGRRKAREDARWLWPEVARIARELGPRYLFLENVPGLLTADSGRAFGDVLGSLASLGYAAEWDCFRASDVGAPHRRERWFLLAYRDGEREQQPHRRGDGERGRALDGGEGRGELADAECDPDARFGGVVAAAQRGVRGEGRAQAVDARRGGQDELADARCVDGDRRSHGSEGRESHRPNARRVEGDGASERSGALGVGQADSDGARLEERERLARDVGPQRATALRGDAHAAAGAAESGVGRDAHGPAREMDGSAWVSAEAEAIEAASSGGAMALRGVRGVPRRSAGSINGTMSWMSGDGAAEGRHDQWPAGRGELQHSWEPPRTAHGVKDRPARLKALGNAVVRQQAALAWRVLSARMGAL